jgi:PAS domain S-box-containing protein
MDKGSLIKLREQLDKAIESDSPVAYAALAEGLADALKKAGGARSTQASPFDASSCDDTASALKTIEDVWFRGSPPPSPLPISPGHQTKLSGLLSDMLAVQSFALAISKGDLSQTLKAKGVMAGSFKAVQGSLRHLTWQTRMIAKGDFSQRVDFMGEFSESFNYMVRSLNEAQDQIKRYTEELLQANADLTAEIAERKQAEEALRVSREWLRVTLNSIGDGVMTTDTQGRITFLNPIAVALTGWELTQAAGQPVQTIFRIINEKTGEPAEDIVQRVMQEGQIAILANNTTLISRDGRKVPIEDSAAPIRNSEGELLGVVLVFQDVTEKRLAQEEICRARDELEIRVQERTAELEKVNRDLADFNHIAAHDLQEPLRQLNIFGDRLVSKCGAALSLEDRYYVTRIQTLARRASSLTSDILKFSMISSRTQYFASTNLNRLIHNVIAEFAGEIEQKKAIVDVEELRPLRVDPLRMADVFRHLISNGLKFTREERPKIRIYGESTSDLQYRIYVEDNGIGFDEVYLDKIFIPFQRLHGRSKYEGSGIGLAICRKILEMHGGSITAKSRPNVGSTFIISLPLNTEAGPNECKRPI